MAEVIGEALVEFRTDDTALDRGLSEAERKVHAFQKKVSGGFLGMGPALAQFGGMLTGAVTVPLVGLAAVATKSFAEFDAAMTESLAIMGDVSDAMRNRMAKSAREVALTTTFSAKQAAEAYFFLASAGLDAAASIEAMPIVARFAQAGMFDMALATELVTDSQSALGLAIRDDAVANMENMIRVTDVLVKANILSNASVEQFAFALTREAGSAMKAFNIDVEEGVAVLAAFADQGIKGEVAGSAFSRILRLIIPSALENADTFRELGIRVFDSTGNVRNLADVIGDLERALVPMNDAQKSAALTALGFQARMQGVILPLLGTSDAIRRYEAGLRDAGGITEEVAEKQLQTFSAQMSLLRSRVEEAFITIGQVLVPIMQDTVIPLIERGIQLFTLFANAFAALPRPIQLAVLGIGAIIALLGPLLLLAGLTAFSLNQVAVAMIRMGVASPTAVASVGGLTVALRGLSLSAGLAAGRFLLIAGAGAALGVGIGLLIKHFDDIVGAWRRMNQEGGAIAQVLTDILHALMGWEDMGEFDTLEAVRGILAKLGQEVRRLPEFFLEGLSGVARLLSGFVVEAFRFGAELMVAMARGVAAGSGILLRALTAVVSGAVDILNPFNWVFGSDIVDVYGRAGAEAGEAVATELERGAQGVARVGALLTQPLTALSRAEVVRSTARLRQEFGLTAEEARRLQQALIAYEGQLRASGAESRQFGAEQMVLAGRTVGFRDALRIALAEAQRVMPPFIANAFRFGIDVILGMARGVAASATVLYRTIGLVVQQAGRLLNPLNWDVGSTLIQVYERAGEQSGGALTDALARSLAGGTTGTAALLNPFTSGIVQAHEQAGIVAADAFQRAYAERFSGGRGRDIITIDPSQIDRLAQALAAVGRSAAEIRNTIGWIVDEMGADFARNEIAAIGAFMNQLGDEARSRFAEAWGTGWTGETMIGPLADLFHAAGFTFFEDYSVGLGEFAAERLGAGFAGAAGTVLTAYRDAGQDAGEALMGALRTAIARNVRTVVDVLRAPLSAMRDVLGDLFAEMRRLAGLPTVESAREAVELAELRLRALGLEPRAERARRQRERELERFDDQLSGLNEQLGDLRDQRSQLGDFEPGQMGFPLQQALDRQIEALEREVDVTQERRDQVEASRSTAERELDVVERQIDALERLSRRRELERELILARGQAADRTLATDGRVLTAMGRLVGEIGSVSGAIRAQVADLQTLFIPSWDQAIGLMDEAASRLTGREPTVPGAGGAGAGAGAGGLEVPEVPPADFDALAEQIKKDIEKAQKDIETEVKGAFRDNLPTILGVAFGSGLLLFRGRIGAILEKTGLGGVLARALPKAFSFKGAGVGLGLAAALTSVTLGAMDLAQGDLSSGIAQIVGPAVGAGIGFAVGGPAGAAIGAGVGSLVGQLAAQWGPELEAFFTGPFVGFFTGPMADVFGTTIPAFFTQAVPGMLEPFTSFFTQTLAGFFGETLPAFFTQTVPGMLEPFTSFFTQTLADFFGQTLPAFFTQTVPSLLRQHFTAENLGRLVGFAGAALVVAMFPIPFMIIKFRERIASFMQGAGTSIRDLPAAVADFIADHWKEIVFALFPLPMAIITFREEIASFLVGIAGRMADLPGDVADFIADHWREIVFALFPVPMAVFEFRGAISAFLGGIGERVRRLTGDIAGFVGERWRLILTALFPLPMAIFAFRERIASFLQGAGERVRRLSGDIAAFVGERWRQIIGALIDAPKWIAEFAVRATNFVSGLLPRIPGWFASIGRAIASAIKDAFLSLLKFDEWLKSALGAAWDKLPGPVKDFLGGVAGGFGALKDWAGLAAGTPAFAGGWAIVGERGPELAYLPQGTAVLPNAVTRALMGAPFLGGFAQGGVVGAHWSRLIEMESYAHGGIVEGGGIASLEAPVVRVEVAAADERMREAVREMLGGRGKGDVNNWAPYQILVQSPDAGEAGRSILEAMRGF